MHPDHALNRASWDQLAAVHGQDAYYDSEALVADASSLIEEEDAALEDAVGAELAGRRVRHLQCHLGLESLEVGGHDRIGGLLEAGDERILSLERLDVLEKLRPALEVVQPCNDQPGVGEAELALRCLLSSRSLNRGWWDRTTAIARRSPARKALRRSFACFLDCSRLMRGDNESSDTTTPFRSAWSPPRSG